MIPGCSQLTTSSFGSRSTTLFAGSQNRFPSILRFDKSIAVFAETAPPPVAKVRNDPEAGNNQWEDIMRIATTALALGLAAAAGLASAAEPSGEISIWSW